MQPAPSTTSSRPRRLLRRLRARVIALAVVIPLGVAGISPFDASAARATRNTPVTAGSGYFGGFTSSGWPVVIRISRGGEVVTKAVATMEFKCSSGLSFADMDGWRDLRIRGRRFSETATGTSSQGGSTFQTTSSIKGRLNRARTRITGTWRNVFVERNAAGAAVDACDTGPLRFTVRR